MRPSAERSACGGDKNVKVLLVDDSATSLLMGQMVFKECIDCEVITACDGAEGVAAALAERPDLILLDVVMPKMDGFAACREMRRHESLQGVPIIMVTSRGEPANVETGYCSGCDAYLTKPINARELLEIVRTYLNYADTPSESSGIGPDTTEVN